MTTHTLTDSGISFAQSEEQRAAVEAVRRFAEGEIRPFAKAHGEEYIPKRQMQPLLKRLTEFGFVCGPIRPENGGLGLSWKTYGLIFEELACVSIDVAATTLIQTLVASLIEKIAPAAIRERYLPGLISCDLIGCMAISEPDVGSNVIEVKCRAKPVDGGYAISGEKTWISNGEYSDLCVCVARTGEKPADLGLFLVERAASGYTSRNIHKLGWNGTSTAQLFFDGARVPEDHRLTPPGQGLRSVTSAFGIARPFVGLSSVGVARAALEAAIGYAKERRQHGKVIAGHQLISAMLAEMATQVDAARLLVWRALDLLDRGINSETESAMAKWYATEIAVDVASKAIQIHGGNGVTREFPVERLFRDARMGTIPDGTTEIQKLIIGRALTGVAAF